MLAELCKGQSSTVKFHRLCCNEYKMLAVHSQNNVGKGSSDKDKKICAICQHYFGKFIGARTLPAKIKKEKYFKTNF